MKVGLSRDEWWPVYAITKADEYWPEVEIPSDLFKEWRVVERRFQKMQKKLHDLFEEAKQLKQKQ